MDNFSGLAFFTVLHGAMACFASSLEMMIEQAQPSDLLDLQSATRPCHMSNALCSTTLVATLVAECTLEGGL